MRVFAPLAVLVATASAFMPTTQFAAPTQYRAASKGRMYMLFGGNAGKKEEGGAAAKGNGKLNPFDAVNKMNELASKSNALTKELAGTFVVGSAMDGKVKVTFTGTQVPIEVEVTEEAMAAGAAKVSAAVTEAMKEGHSKSVALQQTKLNDFYEDLGLGAAMNKLKDTMGKP